MACLIRVAVPADIPDIRALQERWAADGDTIGFSPASAEALAAMCAECLIVAVDADELVGFVSARRKHNDGSMSAAVPRDARYLELDDLYVAPGWRSAGIGSRLVDAATRWASERGIRFMYAYSATRDFDAVLRFYRAQGFTPWSVQLIRDLGADADHGRAGPGPSLRG